MSDHTEPLPVPEGLSDVTRRDLALRLGQLAGLWHYHLQEGEGESAVYELTPVDARVGDSPIRVQAWELLGFVRGFAAARGKGHMIAYKPAMLRE